MIDTRRPEKIKVEINTVGDFKEVLSKFDDNMLINFGTDSLGFEIDSYLADCLSVAFMSRDLQEYLEVNDMS